MSLLEMVLPRVCNIPDYATTSGEDAVEIAALAGLTLDEWQKYVLINALGERADGKWAAPTVGLVVARQNGKNVILLARELAGVFLLGERTIIHSAHEQSTASEHFRAIVEAIESVPDFDRRVLKVSRGKGAEAVELRGGQRILFKTRTGGGARGFGADLIAFDEAQKLPAEAKAALIPTLSARSMEGNAQTWYTGSAVDQLNPSHDGVEFARVRELGIAGHGSVAFFEWSAACDDPDKVTDEMAASPDVQRAANPSIGIRIAPEWIEHERTVELGRREFAVERLGVGDWPRTDGTSAHAMISLDEWQALIVPKSRMQDPVCLAFDVSPDRTKASIAAAGFNQHGKLHAEIGECRSGTGWLIPRLAQLDGQREPVSIVCDGYGPAASVVKALDEIGVKVQTMTGSEYGQACGHLVDKVQQGELAHLGSVEIGQAIAGAKTRPLGDAWAWSRKSSDIDITPLVSVTLAVWAAAGNTLSSEDPTIY